MWLYGKINAYLLPEMLKGEKMLKSLMTLLWDSEQTLLGRLHKD